MDKQEVLRYLRTCSQTAEDAVLRLVDRACEDIENAAQPKTLYRIFDCTVTENALQVNGLTFQSIRLAENLKGCTKVVAFGATLGTEVDRLIRQSAAADTALTMAYQAAGAALIEEVCDALEQTIMQEHGVRLRQRFSPGYYDLALETQRTFFMLLELTKRCGITLTDTMLMIPSKSVTAFIGIEETYD